MKLGKAFADNLALGKGSSFGRKSTLAAWWSGTGRLLVFATVLLVSFFVLFWRLVDLTLVQGHEMRRLSDSNRTRELVRHAPRGLLLDRTGKALVSNIPQFRLLKPCEAESRDCATRISQEEAQQLEKEGLPAGWLLEMDWLREYLYPDATAHVVGYLGELSEEELKSEYYQLRGYLPGDRVGRLGAEATFEEKLRGRDGKELVEVDATGKIRRTLGRQEAVVGEDVTLSLDANLAKVVAEAFPAGEKGAVVVSKPTTGEILALYSSPSFSPNQFSRGLTREEYGEILEDSDRPLFNRAIGGVYPPGSTFKLITAVSGLEEGIINKETQVEDVGVLKIPPFEFPNWYFNQYGKLEGLVDIIKAIQRSNDIYFYKVGEWLGITKLAAWARKMGVGKVLGVELAGEAEGLMPDPAWKNSWFSAPADLAARQNLWYLGDTYHVAIGQGYLLTTPLQVNAWANVIATGGRLCRPTIVKAQSSKLKAQNENCKDLGIKKETIELITEGMKRACEPGGTGWPLFNFSVNVSARQRVSEENQESDARIPVACKTGTAEFGDPKNRTHAWLTVFAPLPQSGSGLENRASTIQPDTITGEPEISVTVLVEAAGEGSNVAAPIARKILEEWFSR